MSERFIPEQHSPDSLAAQLNSLPDNYAVVGSLGRCILLEELKPLRRSNGTPVDIDTIDLSGHDTLATSDKSAAFRVDAGLTKFLRPISTGEWGLFLNGNDLFCTLDGELCQPKKHNLEWAAGSQVTVMPAPIQVELTHIKPGNYKNAELNKRFAAMSAEKYPPLPDDVSKKFAHYKRLNAHYERIGPPDNPYSTSERIYRSLRRNYLRYSPGQVQYAVEATIGSLVRAKRGTIL